MRVKVLDAPDGPRVKPEYDDVAAVARRTGRPAHEVARDLHQRAFRLVSPEKRRQGCDPEQGVVTSESDDRVGPVAAFAGRHRRWAQQQVLSDRVAKSMPTAYQRARLRPQVGPLQGEQRRQLSEDRNRGRRPGEQKRALDSGEKVLLEAMQQNDQEENPAAWYYLGRIYLQRGDIYGADSALTRAEKLAPSCAKDIDGYRRNAWVALIKAGNGFEEQKNLDSALVLYRQAARGLPEVADRLLLRRRRCSTSRGRPTAPRRTMATRWRRAPTSPTRPSRRSGTGRPSTRAPCCSTRKKHAEARRRLRALSQVDAEGHRGQARPGRRVPGHGSGGQGAGDGAGDRRRRRRGGRRRRAAGRRLGGPDERRRQPLQRQEVRRGRGGVRARSPPRSRTTATRCSTWRTPTSR